MRTDDEIRSLVSRLARPHRSGGSVIERVAIVAEGADANEVVAWILAHEGEPEAVAAKAPKGGLHGDRLSGPIGSEPPPPARYVLPADALS